MFGTTGSEIPSVGKVEMSWVPVLSSSVNPHPQSNVSRNGIDDDVPAEGEITAPRPVSGEGNGTSSSFRPESQQNSNANVDYDVAYENEWEPE